MGIINTSNVNTLVFQLPSLESLPRYDIAQQKKTIQNFVKAQKERIDTISSLSKELANGSITKEDFEKQKKIIDENLNKTYHRSPTPEIQKGFNGEVVAKHKNKLGFIFIGDTLKAEENNLYSVNAPKMTLAIGGGLETSFDPMKNDSALIDPRDEFIPQASAQIHLISNSDIDVDGIAGQSAFNNKASIRMRSDVLDFSANQAVIIRSLNTPYIAGVSSNSPGGVHIVAGQKSGGGEYVTPEPMVLGQSLSTTLTEIMTLVGELITVVKDINQGLINLKQILSVHTHVVPLPVPLPTLPSAEIIAYNATTAIVEDVKNVGNIYSVLLNGELAKLNNLMAFSPNSFMSKFNRVN